MPRVATGWDTEAIEFYGLDGHWRRLNLGELALPEEGWKGYDTYGAGALSPDGRWWAGSMLSGFFVIDLRDGSLRLGAPFGGHRYGDAGTATFSWSSDSDEMVVITRGKADRVSLANLRRDPFPRPNVPNLLADGGWIECPRVGRVIPACITYATDGTAQDTRSVPADLQARWAGPTDELDGSVWFSVATSSYGNSRSDWDVVLTDQEFRAQSVLVLPRGSEIDGVGAAVDSATLGLAALNKRMLLAYLSDSGEVVRLLRPGRLNDEYDYWDVSFARNLMEVD